MVKARLKPRPFKMATITTTGAGARAGVGELSGDEDLLVEEDVNQKPVKIPKTSIWDTTDEESEQLQVSLIFNSVSLS